VAAGKKLSFKQEEIKQKGHAIEARICAEDPVTYKPHPGVIRACRHPQGPFLRVDSYAYPGYEVPIYYDPMIAKLITHGRNRTEAIQKMKAAIAEYSIEGVHTTLPFGSFVFEHDAFLSGRFDTQFVQKYYSPEKLLTQQKSKAALAAMIALKYWLQKQKEIKVAEALPTNWALRS
jgi:acetyl/propionyl-CoA carboxylase alpha subunit